MTDDELKIQPYLSLAMTLLHCFTLYDGRVRIQSRGQISRLFLYRFARWVGYQQIINSEDDFPDYVLVKYALLNTEYIVKSGNYYYLTPAGWEMHEQQKWRELYVLFNSVNPDLFLKRKGYSEAQALLHLDEVVNSGIWLR